MHNAAKQPAGTSALCACNAGQSGRRYLLDL